jgi:hypothetical protein
MDVKGRLIEMSEGVYVEADVLRIVEKVQEYDPNLRIKYVNGNANVADSPYALFELCPDGIERKVFDIWVLDDRVLERLEAADNQRHNILVDLDGRNLLVKQARERRYKEKMMENHDIFASVLRSPKGTYSFPVENPDGTKKIVTVDDSGPAKVKHKGE